MCVHTVRYTIFYGVYGLDRSGLQKEERTSKSDMDFNNRKKIWICWVWHGMKLWI